MKLESASFGPSFYQQAETGLQQDQDIVPDSAPVTAPGSGSFAPTETELTFRGDRLTAAAADLDYGDLPFAPELEAPPPPSKAGIDLANLAQPMASLTGHAMTGVTIPARPAPARPAPTRKGP